MMNFEPFGELLTEDNRSNHGRPASKWLLWMGSAMFWSVIAFIVAARATYFDTSVFDFAKLASILHGAL